jgi:hypothetical protein
MIKPQPFDSFDRGSVIRVGGFNASGREFEGETLLATRA